MRLSSWALLCVPPVPCPVDGEWAVTVCVWWCAEKFLLSLSFLLPALYLKLPSLTTILGDYSCLPGARVPNRLTWTVFTGILPFSFSLILPLSGDILFLGNFVGGDGAVTGRTMRASFIPIGN